MIAHMGEAAPEHVRWIAERSRPVDYGGPTEVPYRPLPRDCALDFTIIERAARRDPDKVAVWDGTRALTYAELLARAYALADAIDAAVPAGGTVSSLIHNGPAATVALLAVFGSGRTYVPIDAGHPPERQRALLAEAGAAAVIVEPEMERQLAALAAARAIKLDLAAPARAAPRARPGAGETARFVIFTSGSTGTPKGVAFAASRRLVEEFVDRFHINADDVFASLASMSQTGAADIVALTVGASIRVIDFVRLGIAESLRAFGEARVTVLSFVPSAMRMVLQIPGIEAAFASLRVLDLHGERVLASDLALFRSKLPPDCRICVTYGTTETSAVFAWFYDPEVASGETAPVGYVARSKQVAVLGEDGRSVATGEVGELLVRGEMALGSWQKGGLTAARFLPDPDDPARCVYVTGDLVRQRQDGLFEFVGRKDRQVKIRGLWADLGAIEAALRAADGVDDAVVIVRASPGAADEIAAFVTPALPGAATDVPALRRAVASACADHMVPAIVRVLPAIPRLANYKPDLRALAALVAA